MDLTLKGRLKPEVSYTNSSGLWVSLPSAEMGAGEQASFSYREVQLYVYPPESQYINFKSTFYIRASDLSVMSFTVK